MGSTIDNYMAKIATMKKTEFGLIIEDTEGNIF